MVCGHTTKNAVLVLAFLFTAGVLFAPGAHAELTEQGDLFVRFEGGIDPTALPRQQRAPIAVRVGGTIKTLSGERPQALREIRIELNRGGQLNASGLPVCHYSQLVATSPAQALAACGGGAQVGEGTYNATTAFPEQESFPSQGQILAFNARYHGHEAILAHIFGTNPVSITRVIVFHVSRRPGTYRTVITGELSPTVNHYGYVKGIALRLHRRFFFRGAQRSYLSAACAAPAGFSAALFPFARASMTFADGRTLSSTLTRSCKVSG